MINSPKESLFQQVSNALSTAKQRVIIVSAFIRSETLASLLSGASSGVKIDIYARWRIADIVAGASDMGVFDVAQSKNARFRVHHALHAKIYIADDSALIGSANATDSGLGRHNGKNDNLEILMKCPANSPEVRGVLEQLEAEASNPRKFDEDFIRQMRDIKLPLPNKSGDERDNNWIPSSFPEEMINFGKTGEFAADGVLQDCYALGVTPGITAEQLGRIVSTQKIFLALLDELNQGYKDGISDERGYAILSGEFFIHAENAPQKWDLLKKWIGKFSKEMYVSPSRDGGEEIRRGKRLSTDII